MNTLEHIVKKYNIRAGRQYIIEIPNIGRDQLAELFAELNLNVGAEIGVASGRYSEVLCKANPKLHLYSIDPWLASAYDPEAAAHAVDTDQGKYDERYAEAVKRLAPYNCTIVKKTSMDALDDFEDNSLDFVYIDANHDFPSFTNDLHQWTKKIRIGGIMSGHDYVFFPYRKFNHVKRVLQAYIFCYKRKPLFIVGADAVNEGLIRDKYRSWFWVKRGII